MTHTTNLNLNKPDLTDNVNVITDINDNMDIIDGAYGNKANAIANAHSTLGTDLNTYTTTGMYGIEGATNCPTGYAYGTLTVTRYSSTAYVTQTWQSVIEEKIFIRHSFNGTWQPWEELALNSKIETLRSGKANVRTVWLSLAKNGGSANWEVTLQSVGVYFLMVVGQWNTSWRYIGMVYKNDSTSGLIALDSSTTLSVSISGNTLTFTNNNADNSQNIRCTLIG